MRARRASACTAGRARTPRGRAGAWRRWPRRSASDSCSTITAAMAAPSGCPSSSAPRISSSPTSRACGRRWAWAASTSWGSPGAASSRSCTPPVTRPRCARSPWWVRRPAATSCAGPRTTPGVRQRPRSGRPTRRCGTARSPTTRASGAPSTRSGRSTSSTSGWPPTAWPRAATRATGWPSAGSSSSTSTRATTAEASYPASPVRPWSRWDGTTGSVPSTRPRRSTGWSPPRRWPCSSEAATPRRWKSARRSRRPSASCWPTPPGTHLPVQRTAFSDW